MFSNAFKVVQRKDALVTEWHLYLGRQRFEIELDGTVDLNLAGGVCGVRKSARDAFP